MGIAFRNGMSNKNPINTHDELVARMKAKGYKCQVDAWGDPEFEAYWDKQAEKSRHLKPLPELTDQEFDALQNAARKYR